MKTTTNKFGNAGVEKRVREYNARIAAGEKVLFSLSINTEPHIRAAKARSRDRIIQMKIFGSSTWLTPARVSDKEAAIMRTITKQEAKAIVAHAIREATRTLPFQREGSRVHFREQLDRWETTEFDDYLSVEFGIAFSATASLTVTFARYAGQGFQVSIGWPSTNHTIGTGLAAIALASDVLKAGAYIEAAIAGLPEIEVPKKDGAK
jgi:hypothetical protein